MLDYLCVKRLCKSYKKIKTPSWRSGSRTSSNLLFSCVYFLHTISCRGADALPVEREPTCPGCHDRKSIACTGAYVVFSAKPTNKQAATAASSSRSAESTSLQIKHVTVMKDPPGDLYAGVPQSAIADRRIAVSHLNATADQMAISRQFDEYQYGSVSASYASV